MWETPRQRVWFKLRPGLTRETALDVAAGVLMREKPEGTALYSLDVYPPGEGGSDDPDVVTFMWELAFPTDAYPDDWDNQREQLARVFERELGAPGV